MAVDETLNSKFRAATNSLQNITEKRMMGGTCFLHNGKLGGADRNAEGYARFMFRVGKENEAEALSRKGASIMEQGGRRMGGLIFVDANDCDQHELKEWIELVYSFVGSLPPK